MNKKKCYTFVLFCIVCAGLYFWNTNQNPEKPPLRAGSYYSLTLMNEMRTYPSTSQNQTGYYSEWEAYHKPNVNKLVSQGAWESIGPVNLGGRTLCIAFNSLNPNTLYAGSASGGLWRSYTGGKGANAWERIWTGFPVLAVSAIAVSPQDSNIIYIGTGEVYDYQIQGERGCGSYKTWHLWNRYFKDLRRWANMGEKPGLEL